MADEPSWQRMDLSEMLGKLRQAKKLIEDAALVAASQQAEQAARLVELVPDGQEAGRVHTRRRFT